MPEASQLEVLPPDPARKTSNAHPLDEKLSQEAERILYDGMPTRDKVWTLHVQEGWSLMDIARSQGVSYQAIWQHWQAIEAELESAPPDNQAQKRRAIIRQRLEVQYAKACKILDPERRIVLCLKTLEVMAKLDGLNLEAKDDGQKPVPYAAPEEIAQEVRQQMLKRWNRPSLEMANVIAQTPRAMNNTTDPIRAVDLPRRCLQQHGSAPNVQTTPTTP